MTAAVEVVDFGTERGRGVVARQAVAAEDTVYRCRPDIAVLFTPHARDHCAVCFRRVMTDAEADADGADSDRLLIPPELVRCPHCDLFALCVHCGGERDGVDGSAWLRHEQPCEWLCAVPPQIRAGDTDTLRFLLEFASRLQGGDDALAATITTLRAGAQARDPEVKAAQSDFAALCVSEFKERGLVIPAQVLTDALLMAKDNAVGFPFDDRHTVGWSLDATACMLNHSCLPNAALRQTQWGCLEVVALAPLDPGVEVTIAYLDPDRYPTPRDRRTALLTQFHFICDCALCRAGK